MSKYLVAELEKNKMQEEITQKLAEEKLERHRATLEKIKTQGEERKGYIKSTNKAMRQVLESKPLHQVLQERQAQVESQELAKQKKALEDKRNFVNQDAGSFKRAFGEHEVNYMAKKAEFDQKVAQKKAE